MQLSETSTEMLFTKFHGNFTNHKAKGSRYASVKIRFSIVYILSTGNKLGQIGLFLQTSLVSDPHVPQLPATTSNNHLLDVIKGRHCI